ncbi:hypothetical protein LIPSTDRAFT_333488 [Lipomyces starkeyi NRRL Y-11557]|uniref:HTH CENPB-type domain-containing protein n=1 Tax=Lipomyces starkeyi NRRL Y-11557 TaxID=675824 RepID=A0A1E3PV28_LIPST|nr:hypothetical protein LIPSTDRAFT_333488 [Lipomyces starkeyi NRRL Y-11557]
MANQLLATGTGGTVGKNWASNFIKRRPELKTRLNRIWAAEGGVRKTNRGSYQGSHQSRYQAQVNDENTTAKTTTTSKHSN